MGVLLEFARPVFAETFSEEKYFVYLRYTCN